MASCEGLFGLADFFGLVFALADRDQLVHRIEVIDIELAVQVVQLVLESAGEQARTGDLDLAPQPVLCDDQTRSRRVT